MGVLEPMPDKTTTNMKKFGVIFACLVMLFVSCEQNGPDGTASLNGHECVDLGLSVRWATMNVGAESPEQAGAAFAWGETKVKSTYTYATYFYEHDGSATLKPENDAAHVHWGGRWRMPTAEEWKELQAYCTWTWIEKNGVYGYEVSSMTNGNSIFLPATHNLHANYYASGIYWSSNGSASAYGYPKGFGTSLEINGERISRESRDSYEGSYIRPVCK